MSKNNIAQKCEQMYKIAKKNLEGNSKPNLVDETVVALWNTVGTLQRQNTDLQKIVAEQHKTISQYYHDNRILNTSPSFDAQDKPLMGVSKNVYH